MSDKHYISSFNSSSRYEKKRGSVDTALKPDKKSRHNERETKR